MTHTGSPQMNLAGSRTAAAGARPFDRGPDAVFRNPAGGGAGRYDVVASPIGKLLLVSDGEALTGLYMQPHDRWAAHLDTDWQCDPGALAEPAAQLSAYFAGELTDFDLPLAPTGTPFQLKVWAALTTIPYGETATYANIAQQIGRPTATRAVGAANGRNPISVIVPCHRVIGSNGSLTGYGGGIDRKQKLLALETRAVRSPEFTQLTL